jgi:hypothetical protein
VSGWGQAVLYFYGENTYRCGASSALGLAPSPIFGF